MKLKTYSELISINDYKERFRYASIGGSVGEETFGYLRYLNQKFYHSDEWKRIKNDVITRDKGFDLGMDGYPIRGKIIVHHLNPVSLDDLVNRTPNLLDPEYMISCSLLTHNAIHYGDETLLIDDYVERTPFDTSPWRI